MLVNFKHIDRYIKFKKLKLFYEKKNNILKLFKKFILEKIVYNYFLLIILVIFKSIKR